MKKRVLSGAAAAGLAMCLVLGAAPAIAAPQGGPTASLRGTVRNLEVIDKLRATMEGTTVTRATPPPQIALRNHATGTVFEGADGRGFEITTEGTFACKGVPPGRWQLLFRYWRPSSRSSTLTDTAKILAEVVLTSGRETAVDIDLSVLAPSTARGRILLDGKPIAADWVGFDLLRDDHRNRPESVLGMSFHMTPAKDHYEFSFLQPGEHVFMIARDVGGGRHVRYYSMDPVTIRPSTDEGLDLHFVHRIARIRLVDSEGAPVRRRVVEIDRLGRLVSDSDGLVVVEPAPGRKFAVRAYEAGLTRAGIETMLGRDPRRATTLLGEVELTGEQRVTTARLIVR